RRRHTRSYGDWSSDVCSSDLWRACSPGLAVGADVVAGEQARQEPQHEAVVEALRLRPAGVMEGEHALGHRGQVRAEGDVVAAQRSEERRVGKGCGVRGGASEE